MAKIVVDRTIQFQRKTYKKGETVEISVEDVETLLPYGKLIEEEQPKKVEVEQPKKSTRRVTKKAGK